MPCGGNRVWGDLMGTGDRVLRLRARLSDRDLTLLDWLADHEVLTTVQITHALFGSVGFAQRRLLTLYRLGLVDRFRPLRPGGGSYPWHYVLGHVGAQFVAAGRDEPPPRPARTTERVRRIAASRLLDHQLGVNQLFVDLAAAARTRAGMRLERWWPAQRCAQPGAFSLGLVSPIRPDGHGIWAQDGTRVAFFAEFDTGTEAHRVLVNKLAGYDQHVTAGGPAWPVLFVLTSLARERHLHEVLAAGAGPGRNLVPVATMARDALAADAGPADAVWLLHGAGDTPRRLIDLARIAAAPPTISD
jgi:hypothetical protein